jgi:uncharacterized membrane protein YkgB
MNIFSLDARVIEFLRKSYLPLARIAIFVVYFWFGALKLFDLSPASPLAEALVNATGMGGHFDSLFHILALYECIIGILFLFPKAIRIVIPLLLVHMVIVCSPLILVSQMVWTQPFVPTLEGQYIIKNIVIVALALGIAAQAQPIQSRKRGI